MAATTRGSGAGTGVGGAATAAQSAAATAMTDDAVARAGAVRFAAAVFTSRRLWHLAAPQGLGKTRHGRVLLGASCLVDAYEMWRSRHRPLPYPVRLAVRIGDLLLWSWRSADDEESQQVAGVAATPLVFESGFRSPGAAAAACMAAAAAILGGHRLARRPAQPEQILWYGLMAAPGLGMRAVESAVSASIVKTDQAYTAARYREAHQQGRRNVLVGAQNPPIEDIQQAARVLWYAAAGAPHRPDSSNITGVLQELKTALRERARAEFTGSGPSLTTVRATTLTTPDAARELRLRLFTPVLANWVNVQPAPGQEETTLSGAAVDHLTWYLGQRPGASSVHLRVLARNSLEVSIGDHHEVVTVPDNDAEFLPLRHLDAGVIAVAAAALLLLVPDRPRGGPRETLRRQGGPALALLGLTALVMQRGLAGHRVAPDVVLGASAAASLAAVLAAPQSVIPERLAGGTRGRLVVASTAHLLGAHWTRLAPGRRLLWSLALALLSAVIVMRSPHRGAALADLIWPAVAAVPASGSGPAVDAVVETYNRARRSVDLVLLDRSQRQGARDAVAELRGHVGVVYDLLASPTLRGLLKKDDERLVRERLAAAEAKLAVLPG